MKEQKLYICEHCGTQFAERDKAIECENNHNDKLTVVYKKFRKGIAHPTAIIVEDKEKGTKIQYKFHRIVE